jgi:hypothetical protein
VSGILQAKAAALLHDEQGTVHEDWTGMGGVLISGIPEHLASAYQRAGLA